MITLVMRPDVPPMSWKQFCKQMPAYSIAIDGFVSAGPKFQDLSEGGPRANFNHHEEVDRMATRATTAQVTMAVRLGLFDTFRKDGEPHCLVDANDCDHDVCGAWFTLKYGWMTEFVINPRFNRFVYMVDMQDTTAGAFPFPKDMPVLKELAWTFEPYTDFRLSGRLSSRDPAQFTCVVEDVEHRIMRHINGHGQSIPLDLRYERVGGGPSWAMVREHGAQARTGMLADGIKAFVAVRNRSDGRYNYTIGRMSHLIPFNVDRLLSRMNQVEGLAIGDQWGGGNTIGGSPRVNGSALVPEQVEKEVNDFLATG